MSDILANIAASADGLGKVIYILIVAAGLDILTGLWAAYQSGTLDGDYLPAFIKTHIITRIAPIVLLLVAGIGVGGTDTEGGTGLIVMGSAAATAYLASIVLSIKGNFDDAKAKTKGAPSSIAKDV